MKELIPGLKENVKEAEEQVIPILKAIREIKDKMIINDAEISKDKSVKGKKEEELTKVNTKITDIKTQITNFETSKSSKDTANAQETADKEFIDRKADIETKIKEDIKRIETLLQGNG